MCIVHVGGAGWGTKRREQGGTRTSCGLPRAIGGESRVLSCPLGCLPLGCLPLGCPASGRHGKVQEMPHEGANSCCAWGVRVTARCPCRCPSQHGHSVRGAAEKLPGLTVSSCCRAGLCSSRSLWPPAAAALPALRLLLPLQLDQGRARQCCAELLCCRG